MNLKTVIAGVAALVMGYSAQATTPSWFDAGIESIDKTTWDSAEDPYAYTVTKGVDPVVTVGTWSPTTNAEVIVETGDPSDIAHLKLNNLSNMLEFAISDALDLNDNVGGISSSIKFTAYEADALPEVPEGAKAGVIVVYTSDTVTNYFVLASNGAAENPVNEWQEALVDNVKTLGDPDLENPVDVTVTLIKGSKAVYTIGDYCVTNDVVVAGDEPTLSVAAFKGIGEVYSLTGDKESFYADVKISQTDLAEKKIAEVAITCDDPVEAGLTCKTNGTDIIYTILKDNAFNIVYTADEGYLYGMQANTKTVAYAGGITEDLVVELTAADEPVAAKAKIGDTFYLTFNDAATNAVAGDTVVLLADDSYVTTLTTAADTIDLNEHKLTTDINYSSIYMTGSNKKTVKNGEFAAYVNNTTIKVDGVDLEVTNVVFNATFVPQSTTAGGVLTFHGCEVRNTYDKKGGTAEMSADGYYSMGIQMVADSKFSRIDIVNNTFYQAYRCCLAMSNVPCPIYVYSNTFDGTKCCQKQDDVEKGKKYAAFQIFAQQAPVYIECNTYRGAWIAEPFAMYNEAANVATSEPVVFNGNTIEDTVPYLWAFYLSPDDGGVQVTNQMNIVMGENTYDSTKTDDTQGQYKAVVQDVQEGAVKNLALPTEGEVLVATIYEWTHGDHAETPFYAEEVFINSLAGLAKQNSFVAVPGYSLESLPETLIADNSGTSAFNSYSAELAGARIDTTRYVYLVDALAAVEADETVVMLQDDGTTSFPAVDFTIDTNTNVLYLTASIDLDSDLTITSSGAGEGVDNAAAITIAAGKTLDLSGATIATMESATFTLGAGAKYLQSETTWSEDYTGAFSTVSGYAIVVTTNDTVVTVESQEYVGPTPATATIDAMAATNWVAGGSFPTPVVTVDPAAATWTGSWDGEYPTENPAADTNFTYTVTFTGDYEGSASQTITIKHVQTSTPVVPGSESGDIPAADEEEAKSKVEITIPTGDIAEAVGNDPADQAAYKALFTKVAKAGTESGTYKVDIVFDTESQAVQDIQAAVNDETKEIDLSASSTETTLTTTVKGVYYQMVSGSTLGGMGVTDEVLGDGTSKTLATPKGTSTCFYYIKVSATSSVLK